MKNKKTSDILNNNHYPSNVDSMVGDADVYDGRENAFPKENNPVHGADGKLHTTKITKVRNVSK